MIEPAPVTCECEFDPRHADDEGESCHFHRKCEFCGFEWGGLHCPHDGYQNPCLACGRRPTVVREALDRAGAEPAP